MQHELDWNDLRYARAIAAAGSLRGAARTLRVNQSTVGRRLTALEDAVGAKLFLRGASGYVPTAEGRRLLDVAEDVAERLASLERGQLEAEARVAGRVRLALTAAMGQQVLEGSLATVLEAHPELEVELLTGNRVVDLARGAADVAVRLLQPEGAHLLVRRIGMLRYAMYASRAYLDRHGKPASPMALKDHRVVAQAAPIDGGPEGRWLAANGTEARIVFRTESMPVLRKAAAEGLGLVVLPATMGEEEPSLVRLFPLPDAGERAVWLVYHRDLRDLARVRVVAQAVFDTLRQRLANAAQVVPEPRTRGRKRVPRL